MSVARSLLLAAIRGYKRHVSPYKGFSCACRVHEGRASCSTLGLRAISRFGAWRGLGVLLLRFEHCHRVAQENRTRRFTPRVAQAGFVDCAVPCDVAICDACEIASCCLDCSNIADGIGRWQRRSGSSARGCGLWSAPDPPARPVRQRRMRRRGEPASGAPGDEPPRAR